MEKKGHSTLIFGRSMGKVNYINKMQEITREDFEYLNQFKTLEALREHKYSKINELRVERADLDKKLRKFQGKTVISNTEFKEYEDTINRIKRCNKLLNDFTYIDQVYMQYFRDRCGDL